MRNAVMVIKLVKYLILITIIGVIYIEPVLGFNPESETVTVSFNPEFKNDGTEKWIEETNNLSRNFTIYYPINLWKILPEYADNAATLENINNFISRCLADTTLIIKHIKITGSCSVDGSVAFNNKLSAERFSHFMKYLDKKYPGLYDYPVTSEALGENWNLLRKMVAASDMSSKAAVLNVIDNNSNGNEKLRQLKSLEGRKPYTYMLRNYFPQLRYSDIAFSYDSVYYVAVVPEEIVYEAVEEVNEPEPAIEVTYVKKPLFALKTNMLLDVMTALNVEIEVPVGKRYSLALEWMFPWWKHQKNKESSKPWRLELLTGSLEGRYWYGNRNDRPVLNGWFTGYYWSMGYYDFQHGGKGYQGEFLIDTGITGGYAHKIGKNLSLEYSLGIGYINTHYNHYKDIFADGKWHPIKHNSGHYNWFGPTKAKVSLVWLLNYKAKKGVVR